MDIWQPLFPRMSTTKVQARLTCLGFDPGPCDGKYGPFTRDAVRQCQAAYRLVADGVLGPEIKRLLSQDLPSCRVTVRAVEGQSLSGVARALGTTVEALVEGNRRKRYEDVFPGERLMVHKRAVGAFMYPLAGAEGGTVDLDITFELPWTFALFPMFAIADTGEVRSVMSPSPLAVGLTERENGRVDSIRVSRSLRGRKQGAEPLAIPVAKKSHADYGSPVGSSVQFLPGARESAAAAKTVRRPGGTQFFAMLSGPADINCGTLALLRSGRAAMVSTTCSIAREAAASGAVGVAVNLPGLGDDECSMYSRFVRCLSRECHRLGMKLAVIIPAPFWQADGQVNFQGSFAPERRLPWPNGYDVELLGSLADLVLLDIADRSAFWDSIVLACRHVPRWKLAVVVELRAYRQEPDGQVPMSQEELRTFMARHVVRGGRDEFSRVPYLSYRARGVVRRIWQEDAESLGKLLHAVNRLNILGVVFKGARDAREQVLDEVCRRFIIM